VRDLKISDKQAVLDILARVFVSVADTATLTIVRAV